jgi:hypothetical protein
LDSSEAFDDLNGPWADRRSKVGKDGGKRHVIRQAPHYSATPVISHFFQCCAEPANILPPNSGYITCTANHEYERGHRAVATAAARSGAATESAGSPGAEYLWGNHKIESGQDGDATQLQFSARYRF